MRHLLNTLFVTWEGSYLSLENENVVVPLQNGSVRKIPLLNLESIIYFGHKGASPALLGACAKRKIGFAFISQQGKFLARSVGAENGNVLLRKEQYLKAEDEEYALGIAKAMIVAKLYNSRSILLRGMRDHPLSVDAALFKERCAALLSLARDADRAGDLDSLRGMEGGAAKDYFDCLDGLILQDKKHFFMQGRVKRPPTDPVNTLLSFAYTLLAHDCASALEAVGLDAYSGFMHADRPGRASLALDLMEELRSIYADRFVITLINNRIVSHKDFEQAENGAVLLGKDGRTKFLIKWQEKKKEKITHPYLEEKLEWGLVPYTQALLLARTIRGDLEGYPSFLWK